MTITQSQVTSVVLGTEETIVCAFGVEFPGVAQVPEQKKISNEKPLTCCHPTHLLLHVCNA